MLYLILSKLLIITTNSITFLFFLKTPTFASGEIYFSSVIDSLICQAYYNSSLITVLNQLLVGNINQPSNKKKDDFSEIKTSNLYHLPVPRAFKVKNNLEITCLCMDYSTSSLFFYLLFYLFLFLIQFDFVSFTLIQILNLC